MRPNRMNERNDLIHIIRIMNEFTDVICAHPIMNSHNHSLIIMIIIIILYIHHDVIHYAAECVQWNQRGYDTHEMNP